tara:strand:+ start:343 stop:558 length:216 start_codon:yes stop_codon:yes gene_type:complete
MAYFTSTYVDKSADTFADTFIARLGRVRKCINKHGKADKERKTGVFYLYFGIPKNKGVFPVPDTPSATKAL